MKAFSSAGTQIPPLFPTIKGKLDFPDDHPMIDHFKFVAAKTTVTPKISIPGPSCCHFRTAPEGDITEEYKDDDVLFGDIAATYKKAVHAFYDAGCRYLQMDDIYFAYLCDPKQRIPKEMGRDPDDTLKRYAWMMNEAIKDRPDDMMIGMHMCRDNFQSTYAAEGAYDPAASDILTGCRCLPSWNMTATVQAGSNRCACCRKASSACCPVSSRRKSPQLEPVDDLKRKFDEAAKFADLDQLGIAPQCGFSSTEHGNKISFDDQRRKLELVVTVAEKISGKRLIFRVFLE